jgi:hypothetical protein
MKSDSVEQLTEYQISSYKVKLYSTWNLVSSLFNLTEPY